MPESRLLAQLDEMVAVQQRLELLGRRLGS